MQQRLQKALAAAGVASRRHAEELIAQGRVQVDGQTVSTPGTLVDPDTQNITVDTQPVAAEKHWYVALHKPIGYVSTVSDKHAPRKVTDLVRLPGNPRLVPAGRLDADSEGLIILSNDGDFVYKVTHPSQSLGKTYQATVRGNPSDEAIRTLSKGLMLPGEDRATAPAQARKVGKGDEPGTFVVELVLHEGRNRQVRRMLDTVGHSVVRLVRTRIGPLWLGDLPVGQWRELSPGEVRLIQEGYKGSDANAKTVSGRPLRPAVDTRSSRPSYGGDSRPPRPAGDNRPSYGNNRPAGDGRPAGGGSGGNGRPSYSGPSRPDGFVSGPPRPPRPSGGFNGGPPRPPRPAGDGRSGADRGNNRPFRDYSGGGQKENRPFSPNRPAGNARPAGDARPQNRPNRPFNGGGNSGGGGSSYRPQNDRPAGRPYQGGPNNSNSSGGNGGARYRPNEGNRPAPGGRPQGKQQR